MNLLALAGIGAGIAAGATVAREAKAFHDGKIWVSQGGSPHGSLYGEWLGHRNILVAGAVSFLQHPFATLTAKRAELDARTLENQLFYNGERQYGDAMLIGYDNGSDAFRHTFGSALIVYRMMRKHHLDARQAAGLFQRVANAHERDSWLHLYSPKYSEYSSAMDVHNNKLGAMIGATLAQSHDGNGLSEAQGEAALRDAVLGAIASGQAVVMDGLNTPPRPARVTDIAQVDRAGRPMGLIKCPLSSGEGTPSPYPTPIRMRPDGRKVVDTRLPHVSLDPRTIHAPRESVPQA
jgi:hypothetical protein